MWGHFISLRHFKNTRALKYSLAFKNEKLNIIVTTKAGKKIATLFK